MDLTVLAQPYRESGTTGQTFLSTALGDEDIDDFLVVTAWVRQSGIELLVPGLQALRGRGGRARLIFGVDLDGTSRQGVAIARQVFTDIHVVHDPTGRTFHPKMYLALGERVGYALIGSNNLTAGGLWHNYETGVVATFDPRRSPEIPDGVQSYADRVLADTAICKRVTQAVFDRLVAERWIVDEVADRRRRNEDRPKRASRRGRSSDAPLFTQSQVEKRGRPAPVRRDSSQPRIPRRTRRRVATGPDSWWKPLGAGDAQHPPVGNPTGNVALTNVPKDQDRATFFREVLFGGERWRREGEGATRTELATVSAEVEIAGNEVGRHDLTIVYRPYRSTRGRATTVLRWGEALLATLRNRDVTGWFLLIERADLGAYRVRIAQEEPG